MAKQDKLNRMPPYLPIIVEDWQSDPDTQSMTDAQVGIFFKALLYQWQNGSLPRNAWDFAKKIDSSYDTTLRFLSDYSHLFVCCECSASWSREDCECSESKSRARCENTKLKNLRIDVNSNIALGTTEPNPTEQNQTEPNLPPQGGEGDPPISTPEQEKPSESKSDDSKVRKAVTHLLKLLGTPDKFNKKSVCKRWESLIEPKLETCAVEYVTGLMDYALTVNPVWVRAFSGLSKRDPMEYFVEKYETIEGNRAGDEKFAKLGKGKEKNIVRVEPKFKQTEI